MQLCADVCLLAAMLFFLQEWLRRQGRGIAWGIFCFLPLVLAPFWILGNATALSRQYDTPIFFCWLKTYSVCFAACWFTWLRFSPLHNRRWVQLVSCLILPVNILEAVLLDISTGELAHILNAAAGLLLVASLPFSSHTFQRRGAEGCQDFHYEGVTRLWIAGYTIWNWVFVYLTSPVLSGQHIGVLGVAFAVGMLEPGRWLQARTYSLGAACFLLFTFPNFEVTRMGTAEWSSAGGEVLAASICLCFVMALTMKLAGGQIHKLARDQFPWIVSCRRIAAER